MQQSLEIRHTRNQGEWESWLPPRRPGIYRTDDPTPVTIGCPLAFELPVGWRQLKPSQCLNAAGAPIVDRVPPSRFLASGVCSAPASFVIACRSGTIDLTREPTLRETRAGTKPAVPDLRPVAALLDRIVDDQLCRQIPLNNEGEAGVLVALWIMITDETEAHADALSWYAGVERWRFMLGQDALTDTLCEAAVMNEDVRQRLLAVLRGMAALRGRPSNEET